MSNSIRYQTYIDVGTGQTIGELQRQLIACASDLEFDVVTASLVLSRPDGKDMFYPSIGSMPPSWKARSVDPSRCKRCPVNARLKRSSLPFAYDRGFYAAHDTLDLWEEQAQFGFRTGIAVALHLPYRRHFLLGVDRRAPLPNDLEAMARLIEQLQLLAVYANEAASRLHNLDDTPEAPKLTRRELEILSWTRDGKSAWEIAKITSISQSTVNFHVQNVLKKFGCASKHQAVVRALNLQILR